MTGVLFVAGSVDDEVNGWLERRRRLGQDLRDEVWDGVYHVAPYEHARNGIVAWALGLAVTGPALAAGLVPGGSFNLGDPDDFRVPDLGFHRAPVTPALYMPTAALVVEVLSPGDETIAKLPFYARRGVQEVWVVDPLARTISCHRSGGAYDDSPLLGLDLTELAAGLDWPVS